MGIHTPFISLTIIADFNGCMTVIRIQSTCYSVQMQNKDETSMLNERNETRGNERGGVQEAEHKRQGVV